MKFYLVALVLITTALYATAQPEEPYGYKLTVHLENAPFDSLSIFDYTNERNISVPGKKVGDFTWEIILPDSLVEDSENMVLIVTRYDPITNSSRGVRFLAEKDGEEIIVVNVGVEGKENIIQATYKTQSTFPNDFINAHIDGVDSVVIGDNKYEDFVLLTPEEEDSDIAVRTHDPFFSWFLPSRTRSDVSYEEDLSSYLHLSKKFPNSRFLMTYLSLNLNEFRSKEDVRLVYNNFSDRHKTSKWAKHIERFLNERKFGNIQLPTLVSDSRESIITDSTKHTLVIFSASWCAPCIAEIPLLKNIYNDLSEDLNITYVSIDDKRSLEAFQKLLKENEIPWRAVYAYEDINGVKERYFVTGIPHNILVYPNGDNEVINLNKEAQLERLYALVKQK